MVDEPRHLGPVLQTATPRPTPPMPPYAHRTHHPAGDPTSGFNRPVGNAPLVFHQQPGHLRVEVTRPFRTAWAMGLGFAAAGWTITIGAAAILVVLFGAVLGAAWTGATP